jgi:hypothetical protein
MKSPIHPAASLVFALLTTTLGAQTADILQSNASGVSVRNFTGQKWLDGTPFVMPASSEFSVLGDWSGWKGLPARRWLGPDHWANRL